jgi:hypothetical protein
LSLERASVLKRSSLDAMSGSPDGFGRASYAVLSHNWFS